MALTQEQKKAKEVIKRFKISHYQPGIIQNILKKHGFDLTVEDIEICLEASLSSLSHNSTSEAITSLEPFSVAEVVEANRLNGLEEIEAVIGQCQDLSLVALRNQLAIAVHRQNEHINGLAVGADDEIKTVATIAKVADMLNAISHTVSVDRSIRMLESNGYNVTRNSREWLELRDKQATVFRFLQEIDVYCNQTGKSREEVINDFLKSLPEAQ